MSSEISLLTGTPPPPILRETTSAPIMTVIRSSRRHAAKKSASSRRPYHSDSRAMLGAHWRRSDRSLFLREEFLDLRAVFGALLDDALPARLVGLRPIGFGCRAIELDGLNAGIGLPFRIFRVLRVEYGGRFRFSEFARLAQHGPLRIGELIPGGLVEEDRDLDGIESRVDAILRLLVPAEIKDTGDRPAIAIHNAALERCIDFARWSLHDRGAECLEEVAVDRRDAYLQSGQVGRRNRL